MRTIRRSRRISTHTLPDSLDQCVPGGCDYLQADYAVPPTGHPVATTVSCDQPLSSQALELLSAFADQRELTPPDLHSQSRRRKGKNGNAPRPPNAFILFRSDFWRFNKDTIPERDHRQISRIAGQCWKALAEPRRIPYQDQAIKLKEEHAMMYPQHRYNSSAKDKARKKQMKGDIDEDELCGVLATQVAQDIRVSKPPKISGSSKGGLLDQVMERKVKSKRSRSASIAFGAEAFNVKSQPSKKKNKRDRHEPSADAIQLPSVQSQTCLSHSFFPPFVPTDDIPFLTLPHSHRSPVIKGEPLQDPVPGMAAHNFAIKNEPALSPLGVVESLKMEASEPEVPEVSTLFPSHCFPFGFEPPVQYLETSTDTVVDKGLEFCENYGMVGFFEGLDLNIFENLGDASATMGIPEENDEFASWWCSNPC